MLACGFLPPVSAAVMVRVSMAIEALPVRPEVARRRRRPSVWMRLRLVTLARSSRMATVCISRWTVSSAGLVDSVFGVKLIG